MLPVCCYWDLLYYIYINGRSTLRDMMPLRSASSIISIDRKNVPHHLLFFNGRVSCSALLSDWFYTDNYKFWKWTWLREYNLFKRFITWLSGRALNWKFKCRMFEFHWQIYFRSNAENIIVEGTSSDTLYWNSKCGRHNRWWKKCSSTAAYRVVCSYFPYQFSLLITDKLWK